MDESLSRHFEKSEVRVGQLFPQICLISDFDLLLCIPSIPFERRDDGVERYSSCKMFNRNYSELAQLWTDKSPNEILINHKHLLADENKNYEIINCIHGWTFDRSMFPATVISEV